ncbi:MAG: hypothetical protein KGN76_12180 [Acidobacteriota bacterium]|nr:hypothetical protein [Acidobacteriota bacterium]
MTRVVIRAAGGPRRGFGHLVRCAWLARVLEADAVVSVRGGDTAARVARRLGHRVVEGPAADVLQRTHPDLVLVDDPDGRAAERWCRAARRRRTPVASVHDLGLGRCRSDLQIDGSIEPIRPEKGSRALRGPRYAVLDPALARLRSLRLSETEPRVLIALGGGARAGLAWRLGRRIARQLPDVEVRVAGGFVDRQRSAPEPNLRWLPPANGLGRELARTTVAVLAGGVTLYEACCLGVPVVALAVVPAQRPTIRAFAARGAAIDAGTSRTAGRAVELVLGLMHDARRRRAIGRRARAQVDGRGVWRVAAALSRLAAGGRGSWRHGD